MALVGGVLNANTVLQPQFMQQLLGWNATTAGMALTAGGVMLLFMMPMAGFATGKVAARYLAMAGFIMFVITFRYRGRCDHAGHDLPRGLLAARRPDDASAVLLHLHHHGGLCGHAQGGEQPGRGADQLRAQHRRQHPDRHHQRAGDQPRTLAPAAPAERHDLGQHRFQQHLQALTGFFGGSFGGPNGSGMALASIYNQLNRQAQTQGYQDVYMELSWMSVGLVLLAFLLSKNKPGAGASAAAMH